MKNKQRRSNAIDPKRQSGFTVQPGYLEAAEKFAYGVVSLWEQRGPPDHCEKLDGQWACE